MSKNKDKPLNPDELSEFSDIITDGHSKETHHAGSDHASRDEKIIAEMDLDTDEIVSENSGSEKNTKKRGIVFRTISFLLKGIWSITRFTILVSIVLGSLFFAAYVLKQDDEVRTQFEGKRWALPARVFARPLELYEGQTLQADNLQKELQLLGYSFVTHLVGTGQYTKKKNVFSIQTRGFKFAEDQEISRRIEITIKENKIAKLRDTESNEPLTLMRLEPVLIGNII